MPEGVKNSSQGRGQARTRLARRAVIDAARSLFIEGGYATTTIAAISRRADVPEPTVYRLFSSKLGILKVLFDASIAGDDEPVAVQERPNVTSLFAEPDPHKVLAGFAAVTTQINQRTNDLYSVLSRAADSDVEAAVLVGTLNQQRDRGQEQIVQALHRKQKLRVGLKVRDAADRVHALMSPEVYRLLVTDRGWTPDRYEQWVADTLIQQLT
ncbi:MAG TPA: helix-turn-helix domain-containing protein [Ilumatobacteraceae bacterium]|nr:helix-turn-helix domain-containing protein [Ilumatobacteraceae bacterium]